MRTNLPSYLLQPAKILLCAVVISCFAGCGGGGTPPPPPPPPQPNPAPTVTSVSPNSGLAGSQGFTLTITGANFIPTSSVLFNGGSRPTTFVSNTQLQVAISAADIANTGVDKIAVSNPAPGGGTSTTLDFAVNNPAPAVGGLTPNFIPQGSAAFNLTVTGTGFVPASVVQLNGSVRPTTFVSNTTLQASISAADIAATAVDNITVANPTPGGGGSNAQTFTVTIAAPIIGSVTPGSAVVGAADFAITVTGSGFRSGAIVQFNQTPLATTFVSSTELQAQVTAANIAAIGVGEISVANPITTAAAPGLPAASDGPTSKPWTFLVGSAGGPGFATVILNQQASKLVFDPLQNRIYVSVPHTAATLTDTISTLDLATASLTTSVPAGNNPDALAISDDSQFLYAGIDGTGSVQRFTLPAFTKDISFGLGTGFSGTLTARDIKVAPGSAHTTAVATGDGGGLTIFDDATARPNQIGAFFGFASLQWGADSTTLFADDFEADFESFTVNADGATANKTFQFLFNGGKDFHFLPQTGLIYSDDGHVLHPDTGVSVANLNAQGAVAVDAALNAAFVAGATNGITLESFDLTHFTLVKSISLSGVFGFPQHMIRWGQNGLAFNTDNGQIVLVGGNFLDPVTTTFNPPPPPPPPAPTPAPNAPGITALDPGSGVAGSPGFSLTVNGTNFDPAAQVLINGGARPTTFISATQLQAAIGVADIAKVGTATVTVANPIASGGTSAGFTFFVGSSGGANFAVTSINVPAQDLAYDPSLQRLYLSVANSAANGNSISVLDLGTLTVTGSQFAGSNPGVLSISDDAQFLYAGIDGANAVQRFVLPDLTPDVNYLLGSGFFGPFIALDLQAAPGAPHTSAVTAGFRGSSPQALGGITIFDDATPRPTAAPGVFSLYDSIQWGTDATSLFAANGDDTGFDFYTLAVNPAGVTQTHDFQSVFSLFGNKIHFDRGTNLVYADDGHAVDPATGLPAGIFKTTGPMVPDSGLNTVFYLTQPFAADVTISAFDMTHFTAAGSIDIPNVSGSVKRVIRWGKNGLAFNTTGGQVFLVAGNFLSPIPTTFPTPAPFPTPPSPPTPTAQTPVIASLSPSSAVARSPAFTLTVNGKNFDPAAVVEFNGSPRTTTFISSSELQAAISAGDVATAGVGSVTVANPVANGGTSAGSTFFTGTTAGTGFAVSVINQAANDIVYDPLRQLIFFSVPSTSPSHPNTVSALDLASQSIISSQFAGSEPNVLALSGDSQFLYAGIDGASKVQRFALPSFSIDVSFLLGTAGFGGPNKATDIQVAPGAPNVSAVTTTQRTTTVFDDASPRAATVVGGTSIQWGADPSSLFTTDPNFGELETVSVNAGGATVNQTVADALGNSGRLHFDQGTHLLYSDDGHVVDPGSGLPVAVFQAIGPMAEDSGLNLAFFLNQTLNSPTVTVQAFDLTHFTKVASITVSNVTGNAKRLIRWGQNGLAFNTDKGQIVLIGGEFISPLSTATPPVNPLPTPVAPPVPTAQTPVIANLSPSSAVAGGAAFTLTMNGKNFDPAAVVQFNGSPRTTTFISSTQVQAAITSGDIATPGAAIVTVANPAANGGTSAGSTFFTGASGGAGFAFTQLPVPSNDLLFDPFHQVILLAVGSTASSQGNSISALDPASGNVVSSVFAGSEPGTLALSDDGQFLYAGINGAARVQRYALPALAADISYSLGPASFLSSLPVAADLQVAPGSPHTTAVVIGTGINNSLQVFDDATPRTNSVLNMNSLQWGADATMLFAGGQLSPDLFTFSVDPTGLTQTHDFPSGISGARMHFSAATSLLYTDAGRAIDPLTGLPAGLFQASGLMVPDSSLNAAFFVSKQVGASTATIQAFDLAHFTVMGSVTIPGVNGIIKRLIRWGQNGLAFNTDAGQLFLVGADIVSPIAANNAAPNPLPTPSPQPVPGPLTPVISSLNPGSGLAGGPDITITVNGTNFLNSSVVQFNGAALATTFVSATQLQATIPAGDIAAPGASQIVVANPTANGGNSPSVTFYVGTSVGTGFAANSFNLSANKIAYDPAHRVLFLTSPSSTANGNSISALDPASGTIVSSRFAGSEPDLLALSNDGHFLYAAIEGASRVQRYTLPDFGEDIHYSLGGEGNSGPLNALDLQVAPGISNTTAVALANNNFGFVDAQGVAVFDDAVQRTNRTSSTPSAIQWGSDPTAIYGADQFGGDLLIMSVSPSGVSQNAAFFGSFLIASPKIHFDSSTKLVYGNDGHIVDPLTGAVVGTFTLPGPAATNLMVPDFGLNRAFFLTQTQPLGGGPTTVTLQSFDLTTFAPVTSIVIPNVNGLAQSFIRWGDDGLAFNTNGGEIHLIGGNFIH